jgi:hypothetical protein
MTFLWWFSKQYFVMWLSREAKLNHLSFDVSSPHGSAGGKTAAFGNGKIFARTTKSLTMEVKIDRQGAPKTGVT